MEDPDKKPFKMTDNMHHLGQSRQTKIERELEDEFRQQTYERKMADSKAAKPGASATKKSTMKNNFLSGLDEDESGIGGFKEKTECLLLQS
jgi:hypothetical protein